MKKLFNLTLKLTQLTTLQSRCYAKLRLSHKQVKERQKQYGPNRLKEVEKEPVIVTFIRNFTSLMAILLWVGGAVAILSHSC